MDSGWSSIAQIARTVRPASPSVPFPQLYQTKGEVMVRKAGLPLIVLVCLALASPCLAQQRETRASGEIKALLERHNQALNAHDLKGIMENYAPDPNIVLMGTGPGESYVGEEAIGGAYNQFFSRFEAKTLTFSADVAASGVRGNTAWFAANVKIDGIANNEKRERVFNMSGTLTKMKGKWRIVSLHFSRLGVDQAN
jgi:ketosteroid isomerase-like protein